MNLKEARRDHTSEYWEGLVRLREKSGTDTIPGRNLPDNYCSMYYLGANG